MLAIQIILSAQESNPGALRGRPAVGKIGVNLNGVVSSWRVWKPKTQVSWFSLGSSFLVITSITRKLDSDFHAKNSICGDKQIYYYYFYNATDRRFQKITLNKFKIITN